MTARWEVREVAASQVQALFDEGWEPFAATAFTGFKESRYFLRRVLARRQGVGNG